MKSPPRGKLIAPTAAELHLRKCGFCCILIAQTPILRLDRLPLTGMR